MNAPMLVTPMTSKSGRLARHIATEMEFFGAGEWVLLLLWFTAIIWPLFYAIRHKTSLAFVDGGLLLAYLVQVIYLLTVRQFWLEVVGPCGQIFGWFHLGHLHLNGCIR